MHECSLEDCENEVLRQGISEWSDMCPEHHRQYHANDPGYVHNRVGSS